MAWFHRAFDEKQDSTREKGGFFSISLGSFFGGKSTQQQKMATHPEQQRPVINSQPTTKNPHLQKSFNLPEEEHDDWEELKHPDKDKEGGELTEREKQLMEAIDDRTNEKSQLASKNYQMQEEVDKLNQEILLLRDQIKQLAAELEGKKAQLQQFKSDSAKEESGSHTQSEMQEVACLKRRVSELEDQLATLQNHSKYQSRKVLELKTEAFKAEMLEGEIQSFESLLEEAEKQQGRLQKDLGMAHSELDTVTKYKESVEKELIMLKQEAFRVAQENEELRTRIIRFSETIEAENELKRAIYKLENENGELKDQLESAQAQVVVFQSDFADERKDREQAHSKLADLEKELAQQKGLYTEEKAEYNRQLTIAHQEAESARKELEQANKELENHKATLASVEALNQKLQQQKTKEATDNYWRGEAAKLKTQLQEAEEHVSQLLASKEDYQAKETQVKQLMKKLETKSGELDKMSKRVKKLEEGGKSKKKKTSDGTSPQDCVETARRNLAKTEQLYNDASLEIQELQQEVTKLKAQYKQLKNQNVELKRRVDAMKASFKEQDKQLQQKCESEATTPINSSEIRDQFQRQYDHGQMLDTQPGEFANEGRAVRDVTKLPIRAAPPLPNAIPDFDVVTSDSASPRHPHRPLRASHPDVLPSPNASGPSSMSHEEHLSGNLPHLPANTMPGNYPQGPAGSVAEQMQFQQFPQPRVGPGVPQILNTPGPQEKSAYTNYNPPYDYEQQQQPFQHQQGYAGGPGQPMLQYPPQFPNEQELLIQRMQERQQQQQHQQQIQSQEQQRLMQEQENQQFSLAQLREQQMQAQDQQQHVHVNDHQPAYPHSGMPNQEVPPNQQYDQAGLLRPSNVPYQPNLSSAIDCYTSGDTPTTPEGQNFVIAQQSSNSQPSTGSLVGIQKPVQSPRPHSNEVMLDGPKRDGMEKECHHGAQPKPQSDPFPNPSNETFEPPISARNEAPCETDPIPEMDPNESGGEGRFGNILQESIDKDIERFAAEVRDNVSGSREHIVTNTDRPFDPNLVCPMCNKAFRIGEIQKFRAHVNQCEGTKKGGVNN